MTTASSIIDRFKTSSSWMRGISSVPHFFENATDLVIATTVINLLSLAIPIGLMQAYDRIIPHQATGTLTWIAVGAFIALFLEVILRFCRTFITSWVSARFEHLVGTSAVDRILSGRLDTFEGTGLGEHLERLNAVSVLRSFFAGQVFQILLDLPFAGLFLFSIWFLAGDLVYFPLAIVVLFFLIIYLVKGRFETIRKDQVTLNDRRFTFIIELLSGIHLLKAQAMEEQMLRRHERLLGSVAKRNMQVSFWSGLPTIVGGAFAQITMFGVIIIGGLSVIAGEMTVGELAACTLLAGRSVQPLQNVATFWLRFSNAKIARSQLSKVAATELETPEGTPLFPSDIDGSIEFQNVSFRYREDTPFIAENLNLKIAPGEMMAFIESSSSGTSTLVQLLMGVLKPETGSVFIDDYNIAEWDHSNLQGRIDYVPPTGTLFKGTILDNIAMFNPKHHAAALDAAALLELDEPVALLPQGYETKVDNQASILLPGGLIQRICIARALVGRPRIIIFDKVSSAMDQESIAAFDRLVLRLKGSCTMIVITNRASIIRNADTVYKLSDGFLSTVDTDALV